MSEAAASYKVVTELTDIAWSKFLKRACLESYSSGKYRTPNPQEVSTLFNKMKWTHQDVASMVGVQFEEERARGSTTVKCWLRPSHSSAHRKITYATWRLLLINAGLANS